MRSEHIHQDFRSAVGDLFEFNRDPIGVMMHEARNACDIKCDFKPVFERSSMNHSDTGFLNDNNWNETNIREIKEQGKKATQLAKYRASKSLAEKGASL